MPDFEAMLQFLILFGGFMAILVGAGFGFKKLGQKPAVDPRLPERLTDLEARLADIEERLEFTERALTEVRGRVQIPPRA